VVNLSANSCILLLYYK